MIFNWKTSDTKEQVYEETRKGEFVVYVLCPDGTKIKEEDYKGDGIFGGKHLYALVHLWNGPTMINSYESKDEEILIYAGIKTLFNRTTLKYPIKIVRDGKLNYDEVEGSEEILKLFTEED